MKSQSGQGLRAGVLVKLTLAIGTVLVGCGILGLIPGRMANGGANKLIGILHAGAPSRGLPVIPAAGGAMFVSGAIVLFSGRNRIS